ncbi:MAG TPA: TonB-dependent receptor [Bacteroidales bacterium]|nr:TonB-dependent receptor [Bacteroidales bacterium]
MDRVYLKIWLNSLVFSFLAAFAGYGQNLQGFVFEKDNSGHKSPLPGANVYWQGTTRGTFTDGSGKFTLAHPSGVSDRLIFSLMGYRPDTVKISPAQRKVEVEMVPATHDLTEVLVHGKQDNTFISKFNPRTVTVITTGELQRAACCNLAESFETNASVDVSYSDALSGARQIQLLGLSGIYSQIMTENVPLIRGLATPYGLNSIPGSWMESIQIAKGTSSVAQGYESVTGQINVEYKKPENGNKLFVNLYGNSNLRLEGNADGAVKINDRLSTSLLVHAATFRNKFDRNNTDSAGRHDGFLDAPLVTTLTAMNRWDYILTNHWVSRFGIKYLHEDRDGGQVTFNKDNWNTDTTGISGNSKPYGLGVKTRRLEAFWKNGIFIGPAGRSSLGLILSAINHNQDGFYGINLYHGHEQNFNANLVFTTSLDSSRHRISAGLSGFSDAYNEQFIQTRLIYRYETLPAGTTATSSDLFTLVGDSVSTFTLDRREWTAGAFFEYTFDIHDKFAVIAGLRGDYNSRFGYLVTPRLHIRFNPSKSTTIRASAGKGYRSPNLLAENSAVFVSQRLLSFAPDLGFEEAWNYGVNFTWNFTLFNEKAELAADLYRTDFVKQIIADQDSLPARMFFYNLNGKSYANSLQLQLTVSPVKRFTVTAAFRYNDVQVTEGGKLRQKSMVNLYKGLLSVGYATRFEKWKFDLTGQLNGPSRIPDTDKMPSFLQRSQWSPVWVNLLGQITRKFKYFNIYLGGENLLNFRQINPITEYWRPYHTHFDASMAWGPVTGVSVYAGVRLTIK